MSHRDLNTLRVLMKENRVKEIRQFCSQIDIGLKDFSKSLLNEDTLSACLVPDDIPFPLQNYIIVKTTGDGNCLYNALSIHLRGNEDLARQLRLLVAAELFLHADYYTRHPKIETSLKEKDCVLSRAAYENICLSGDDIQSPGEEWDFRREIMKEAVQTCEEGSWSGLIHLFAAASVMKARIWSSYPNTNMAIRPLFNGCIGPRDYTTSSIFVILWTRDGDFDATRGLPFQPNHFVPLIDLACGYEFEEDIPDEVWVSLDATVEEYHKDNEFTEGVNDESNHTIDMGETSDCEGVNAETNKITDMGETSNTEGGKAETNQTNDTRDNSNAEGGKADTNQTADMRDNSNAEGGNAESNQTTDIGKNLNPEGGNAETNQATDMRETSNNKSGNADTIHTSDMRENSNAEGGKAETNQITDMGENSNAAGENAEANKTTDMGENSNAEGGNAETNKAIDIGENSNPEGGNAETDQATDMGENLNNVGGNAEKNQTSDMEEKSKAEGGNAERSQTTDTGENPNAEGGNAETNQTADISKNSNAEGENAETNQDSEMGENFNAAGENAEANKTTDMGENSNAEGGNAETNKAIDIRENSNPEGGNAETDQATDMGENLNNVGGNAEKNQTSDMEEKSKAEGGNAERSQTTDTGENPNAEGGNAETNQTADISKNSNAEGENAETNQDSEMGENFNAEGGNAETNQTTDMGENSNAEGENAENSLTTDKADNSDAEGGKPATNQTIDIGEKGGSAERNQSLEMNTDNDQSDDDYNTADNEPLAKLLKKKNEMNKNQQELKKKKMKKTSQNQMLRCSDLPQMSDGYSTADNTPLCQFMNRKEYSCTQSHVSETKDKAKHEMERKEKSKKRKLSEDVQLNTNARSSKIAKRSQTATVISPESSEANKESSESEVEEDNESDTELNKAAAYSGPSDNDTDSTSGDDSSLSDVRWSSKLINTKDQPFTGPIPGPTCASSPNRSPLDQFHTIFPESIYELMKSSTNKYYPIYQAKRQKTKPDWEDKYWEPVDTHDIRAYKGIRMLMAINQMPSIDDYWSSNPLLRNGLISNTMTRNMFKHLTRYFHVNDPTKDPSRAMDSKKSEKKKRKDPLYKVSPLMEQVRKNSLLSYNLHKEVAIDEAMVKCHGQHWGIVGAPNKPAKRGFKIFMISDSITGYTSNFQVYMRAQNETGLTQKVVENLTEDIQGFNHVVFIDKFYTSVPLSVSLLRNKIYVCGSFNTSRRFWPKDLKINKKVRKKRR